MPCSSLLLAGKFENRPLGPTTLSHAILAAANFEEEVLRCAPTASRGRQDFGSGLGRPLGASSCTRMKAGVMSRISGQHAANLSCEEASYANGPLHHRGLCGPGVRLCHSAAGPNGASNEQDQGNSPHPREE